MFDFAWSEIMLIGAVALIAIGPKDMPAAIKTVSTMVKKARKMAAEFQSHVDDMMRDADLADVKKTFTDLKNLNLPDLVEKHIDPDRTIRSTVERDLLSTSDSDLTDQTPAAIEAALAVEEPAPEPPAPVYPPVDPSIPAFIPPSLLPKPAIEAAQPEVPAFIPPEVAARRQT